MSQYDLMVLLAESQGFPVDSDGYVDASSPMDNGPSEASL